MAPRSTQTVVDPPGAAPWSGVRDEISAADAGQSVDGSRVFRLSTSSFASVLRHFSTSTPSNPSFSMPSPLSFSSTFGFSPSPSPPRTAFVRQATLCCVYTGCYLFLLGATLHPSFFRSPTLKSEGSANRPEAPSVLASPTPASSSLFYLCVSYFVAGAPFVLLFPLSVVWLLNAACAGLATFYFRRMCGGIVVASTLLDVRFPRPSAALSESRETNSTCRLLPPSWGNEGSDRPKLREDGGKGARHDRASVVSGVYSDAWSSSYGPPDVGEKQNEWGKDAEPPAASPPSACPVRGAPSGDSPLGIAAVALPTSPGRRPEDRASPPRSSIEWGREALALKADAKRKAESGENGPGDRRENRDVEQGADEDARASERHSATPRGSCVSRERGPSFLGQGTICSVSSLVRSRQGSIVGVDSSGSVPDSEYDHRAFLASLGLFPSSSSSDSQRAGQRNASAKREDRREGARRRDSPGDTSEPRYSEPPAFVLRRFLCTRGAAGARACSRQLASWRRRFSSEISGPLARRLVSVSVVSLAIFGSVFACLHELLLLLAFRVEGEKRVATWPVVTSVAYAELPFLLLFTSLFRWWRPCLSVSRTVGVLLLLGANALLCFSPLFFSPLPFARVSDGLFILSNSYASLTSFTSSFAFGAVPCSSLSPSPVEEDAFPAPDLAATGLWAPPFPSPLTQPSFEASLSSSAPFAFSSAPLAALSESSTSTTTSTASPWSPRPSESASSSDEPPSKSSEAALASAPSNPPRRDAATAPTSLPSPDQVETALLLRRNAQNSAKSDPRHPSSDGEASGHRGHAATEDKREATVGKVSSAASAEKLSDGHRRVEAHAAAMMLAVGALFASLVASLSLALALHAGLSVLTACILRFFTQGLIGSLGLVYGIAWGHSVDSAGLASAVHPASPLATAASCVGACVLGVLATVSFFKSVSLSSLPLSSDIRGGCWAVVALLALAVNHSVLPASVSFLLLLALSGSLLFCWGCVGRHVHNESACVRPLGAAELPPRIFRIPPSDDEFSSALCESLLPEEGDETAREERHAAAVGEEREEDRGVSDEDSEQGWCRRGRCGEEQRQIRDDEYCADDEGESADPLAERCDTCGEAQQIEALLDRSRSRVPVGYSGDVGRVRVLGGGERCEAGEGGCSGARAWM
ncbi:conserved hypothetical protein [Neospora caninum Liverpool]|uniref:Transmembrane protein n=1 Tax=Neospora caninum (strain Liverpool) TaxID=572307 RepID=F0VAY4_NEOCL|nr:conserved hypothetical protein [Neospora caninum Liverpool]CBZ51360.1 conserved hypothetical protein [Neospora caninum Liverpool]CEL68679.1 TPA: hypothetical protein BN1204_044240 [Neospora caninum Liverpool]|eukprot:XP_003881393.1 conserved hypothetical protein [Neospora caninum Liverpool]